MVFAACHGVLEERLGYNHLKLCMRFKRHHNSYTYKHTYTRTEKYFWRMNE